MKKTLRTIAVLALVAGFTVIPFAGAEAHPWRCQGSTPFHWENPVGVKFELKNVQFSGPAKKAIKDFNNKFGGVAKLASGGNQMTVVDGKEGDTGWAGLAKVKPDANCHLTHADVIYNSFYTSEASFAQGVFCQEIGHSFGLDHSDSGDCMGLGYFNSGTSNFSGHNATDLKQMYGHSHGAALQGGEKFAGKTLLFAAWGFQPDSAAEIRAEADVIVEAEAVGSSPAAPLITEDGIDIPMTEVTLEVDTAYEGASPGETITVQQVGGEGSFLSEDPAYRDGQEYFLMLAEAEGDDLRIVSPDARYSLKADGTMAPTMETAISSTVSGQSVSAFTGSLNLSPIQQKREFGGEGLTRILIIVGIVIIALAALAFGARKVLGR